MKIRWLAAACLALSLAALASAQSDSIRITNNTRLRATYSLQGRILETAPAGTVLQVTGALGKWLKISRNNRDMWMANWVDYVKVDSQPAATNIDNCCFIDRQCASDSEWQQGYRAFKNNECAAPTHTQKPASAPASAPVSAPASHPSFADVDNCCLLGWPCASDNDWTRGYLSYHDDQCRFGGAKVAGSSAFVAMVEQAYALLLSRAPNWFMYVIAELHAIEEQPPGTRSGIYIDSQTFGSSFDPAHAVTEGDVIGMVGGLVHEACHAHQWHEGTATVGWRNEIRCVQEQLAATEAVDPSKRHSPWLRNLIANIENPEYWWWD